MALVIFVYSPISSGASAHKIHSQSERALKDSQFQKRQAQRNLQQAREYQFFPGPIGTTPRSGFTELDQIRAQQDYLRARQQLQNAEGREYLRQRNYEYQKRERQYQKQRRRH